MAYSILPKIRKCASWLFGVYNASIYTPAVPSDGDTAVGEVVAPNSLPLLTSPLLLKAILSCLIVT
jgi:hypothetical protein